MLSNNIVGKVMSEIYLGEPVEENGVPRNFLFSKSPNNFRIREYLVSLISAQKSAIFPLEKNHSECHSHELGGSLRMIFERVSDEEASSFR